MRDKPLKRKKGLAAAAVLCMMCCVIVSAAKGTKPPERDVRQVSGNAEIADALRAAMKERASAVTVTFASKERALERVEALSAAWMEEALADTGDPAEGDYLRYQYGGYHTKASAVHSGEGYLHTVRIEPVYYSTTAQEAQVTEKVEAILGQMAFSPDATDVEKCTAIYDYLCTHVTYDRVHHKNPYNLIDATAYDALVRQTASCQGYCTALYRLLRESGVDCRIVTGTAGTEEKHAWCLAKIDGAWLLLDPTFDAGNETYRFFLLPPGEAKDHIPDTGKE